jgi:hypothetical protein
VSQKVENGLSLLLANSLITATTSVEMRIDEMERTLLTKLNLSVKKTAPNGQVSRDEYKLDVDYNG